MADKIEAHERRIIVNVIANLTGQYIDSNVPLSISRDDRNRFHSVNGYAVKYEKGPKLYFLHGINFSTEDFQKYVSAKRAKPGEIISIKNQEQKMALIKYYGFEYVFNVLPNLKLIDEEKVNGKTHELWEFWFPAENQSTAGTPFMISPRDRLNLVGFSTPMASSGAFVGNWERNVRYKFLKLQDHSTEHVYYLGVPSHITKVNEGRAWTFGLQAKDYDPIMES